MLQMLKASSHGSQVLSPTSLESQFMQSQPVRAWELGRVLRVGLSNKLDANPTNIVAYNNQDPTLMISNHISMVS